MERMITVAPGVSLWSRSSGDPNGSPLLLVMGANSSGLTWPDEFVEQLGRVHHVVRYDHRDSGSSSWAFADVPYALTDLAEDAVALLDAYGFDRAHVVGMSLGGTLTQLLLLDHPDRLRSATLFATGALGPAPDAPAGAPSRRELPGPDPRLLELWEQLADARGESDELDWRVDHWRLLNGDDTPFDADEFRRMEQAIMRHAGRHDSSLAHAQASQEGLDRGDELANVAVPTLVVETPADPVYPPPHAEHLASMVGSARLVTIPGMGHAIGRATVEPLVTAILTHTGTADAE
jgi:pimeloyl-ACP methyl ester carboxylesterase